MIVRQRQLAAFASFAMLGTAYLATVVLTLSAVGMSWIVSPSLPQERDLLVDLSLRMMAAFLCAAVLVVLTRLPRWRNLGVWLVWSLALGVTIVLLWDGISTHAPAGVWGIAALIVVLHLWLVRTFYLASRHDAF